MSSKSFASRTYRDTAVVLRTHKLGEADRIIVMLSARHGQIRAVAKGVRRTSSRFGARLEPFMVADMQLVSGRSLDIVTQAVSRATYGGPIVADYTRYTVAVAMCETAERLTDVDGESAAEQYTLLVGALAALGRDAHPAGLIMDSYLLRALSTAGWEPSFTACARCDAPGPHSAFSAAIGGAICPDCRPPGAASPAPETMRLLAALLDGDWPVTDVSDPRHRREASGLVAGFVQWHLERAVKSLKHVERV